MNPLDASRRLVSNRRLAALGRVAASTDLAFATGGTLRDVLLGLPVHDFDLAVSNGAGDVAAALAATLPGRLVRLGRPPLATWRVVAARLTVDVADIQGGVEADVRRRDFTVNAMLWRLPRGPFVDLLGGLDDLAARRLTVVDPRNLRADPLRVLRGLRLHATRDLSLTTTSADQLAAAAPGLRRVARERIVDELRLLLAGARAGRALAVAARLGILAPVLVAWDVPVAALAAADQAARLVAHARSRSRWLARGARAVLPAVLAAPAARFPLGWDRDLANSALVDLGWPRRAARGATAAAALGEELAAALADHPATARELLARGDGDPASALAWACASGLARGVDLTPAARALWSWWRRFQGRPPLLRAEEVARLADLPEGPSRSLALRTLRAAQAAGTIRNRRQALRWLAEYPVR